MWMCSAAWLAHPRRQLAVRPRAAAPSRVSRRTRAATIGITTRGARRRAAAAPVCSRARSTGPRNGGSPSSTTSRSRAAARRGSWMRSTSSASSSVKRRDSPRRRACAPCAGGDDAGRGSRCAGPPPATDAASATASSTRTGVLVHVVRAQRAIPRFSSSPHASSSSDDRERRRQSQRLAVRVLRQHAAGDQVLGHRTSQYPLLGQVDARPQPAHAHRVDAEPTDTPQRVAQSWTPARAALANSAPSRTRSMTARPTAHASGLPPNVEPCDPGVSTPRMSQSATTADSGTMPPPSALPRMYMSGTTPSWSQANSLPVRPKPDCTSSAIKQDVVRAAQVAQAGEETVGRDDHAGLALDRLDQHGGDGVVDGGGDRVEIAVAHAAEPRCERTEPVLRCRRRTRSRRSWSCGRGSCCRTR